MGDDGAAALDALMRRLADDQRHLWVARNRGELRVFIRRTGGPTVIDDRRSLWNDGTSWYDEHQDSQSDTFTDSTFFFGAPGDSFEVWFAFDSSIDYHHRGGLFDFGSSQASNSLFADLRFIVFEQFAP